MIRRVGNAEGSGLRLSLVLRQVGESATRSSKTRTYQAPWKPDLRELHERLERVIEEYYRQPPKLKVVS